MHSKRIKSTLPIHAYLSISILDGRYVGLAEGSFHETQHEGTLADTARPENDHTIVVALLRHPDICRPGNVNPRRSGSLAHEESEVDDEGKGGERVGAGGEGMGSERCMCTRRSLFSSQPPVTTRPVARHTKVVLGIPPSQIHLRCPFNVG